MPGDETVLSLEEKRARLALVLQRKANQPVEAPLSFSQQRLWFVDQIDPGSPLYNITVTIRISGALRLDYAQRIIDAVVARHETLRTIFAVKDGQPVQRILPRGVAATDFAEVHALPGDGEEEKIAGYVHAQALTRFDLSAGPLFRTAFLRIDDNEHLLCFTLHHIISDGWSIGVVLFEWAALYGQATGQSSRPLPAPRIQYRDYAKWQRERLQGVELERLLEFWQTYLKGAPHALDLPTDRPRPGTVTYNGTIYRFRLQTSLLEGLKTFSREKGTTFFMTVLAAYAVLLHHYTDQQEMLIGVPATGRERTEVQPLIGYFVNIVVARFDLSGNPTFRELLVRVRESALAALAHQEIPFEKLVEALRPKRTTDRHPLVQVVYLHQSFPLPGTDVCPGLTFTPMEYHPGFSRFELGLRTEPDAEGVGCIFEYNTDLYETETIARMADQLQLLLQGVIADPMQRIGEIPILTDVERQRLVRASGAAGTAKISPRRLKKAALGFVPPATDTEIAIAALWREVLGLETIGIHDDFFELGGNSLLAMQLVTALGERWKCDIPLRALFSDPTVATAARLIDDGIAGRSHGTLTPIMPAPPDARLPLSSSQQLLFLMEQFDQGIAFNAALAFRLQGRLDRAALAHSIDDVVRRHEILRASIQIVDGQPTHVVGPPGPARLEFHDLRSLPADQRESEATRLAEEMTRTRFDLAAGNLARFSVTQLSADEHLLHVAIHHLVSDGWSFPILFGEIVQTYQACATGQESLPPELPIQFTDYAYWQRHDERSDAREQAAYWRERLNGELPTLELPTDFTRSDRMSVQPETCELAISAETIAALKQLSRQEGVTLYMTLLTAYAVLLHKYTRQEDILIGSVTANRLRPETQNLIGFFASLLPLRCDLMNDPTFLALLQRVRGVCVEAYGRSEIRLDELTQSFRIPTPGMMPICQTLFTFWEFPEQSVSTGELTWTPFNLNVVRVSGYDLVLALRPDGDTVTGAFLYRPDLFRSQTVEQMRECFLDLLNSIVADPTVRLTHLRRPSAPERQRLLSDWNDTFAPFAQDLCVQDLFEAQAARTPDATAIISADATLTYRQLNRHANSLALRLRSLNVGVESLVAILVDRGPDMVAALLAVLKAGGAYLPLDPSWPAQRISAILRNAAPAAVISRRHLADAMAAPSEDGRHAPPCIDLDDLSFSSRRELEDSDNLPRVAKPTNLAYVIYTSGSSGPSKGVLIEHRSVVNVITSFIKAYNMKASDRVLQQASVAFDVSVNEIFPVLSSGGALVIPRPDEAADFDSLAQLIQAEQVTIMGATPSGLTELNRRADRLQSLRLVLSGGETLNHSHVDRLAKFATLTNGYGPTETTVCATFFDLRELTSLDRGSIPIGKPLPNYRVYVLDEQLEPLPIGLRGELCIAGAGLARGYLGDASLTDEKFVANPFSPGERLYRTGDEARWLPDGNLEFLGRLDRQVKIRGFRVELGEIEAALGEHAAVKQSVALCDRDASGNARIVAYIVTESAVESTDSIRSELREFLSQKLPSHLLPAVFMFVPEIPLTANQKVNFAALPKPQAVRPELDVPFVAPRNADEEALASIWRAALQLDRVGVDDNFFAIGGHSLLAAQILYRVQQELAITYSYQDFFHLPTVALMAARLEALRSAGDASQGHESRKVSPLVPLSGSRGTPVYCIHAFGGQAYEYVELAQRLGPNFSVFGLQSRATLDYREESASWQAMAEDYARVIREHQPEGPYYLAGHSAGGVLAFAVAHALEQDNARVGQLILIDSFWTLDELSIVRGAEQELVAALRETFRHMAPQQAGPWDAIISDPARLHEEFFALTSEARLEKLESWIGAIGFLPADIANQLKSQLRLHDLHRSLFNGHALRRISAPLSVAWADETLPGTQPLARFEWADWTSGPVESMAFAANHFSILKPPATAELARWVATRLPAASQLEDTKPT